MEELFRFIMARPAQKAADAVTIPVTPNPDYLGRLREAHARAGAEGVKRVAAEFRASKQLVQSLSELKFGMGCFALSHDLGAPDKTTLEALEKAIRKHAGVSAKDMAADEGFASDRLRLSDSVVTSVVLATEGALTVAEATRILRTMALVARVAAGDASLTERGAVSDAYTRVLMLPSNPFPMKPKGQGQPSGGTAESGAGAAGDRVRLAQRRDALLSTYNALTRVSPDHLAIADPPTATEDRSASNPRVAMAAAIAPTMASSLGERLVEGGPVRDLAATSLSAVPTPAAPALLLRADVLEGLASPLKSVLTERNLDLSKTSLPFALDRLSVELTDVEMRLAELDTPPPMAMAKLGSMIVPGLSLSPAGMIPMAPPSVPSTHGSVAPAGIGDLLVVRQFLKRYEAYELGHIENVLKGEYKERMHRRARTTEETITVETEIKKEEERDLQTTERFELKTESSETLKQDQSLKIGVSVSGSYGPTVEFKASTDFAMSQSKEEASKIATSFSKDVTQRAASKVSERRREERILKTIEVFEEKNTHGVDNKLGTDHVVGQYQWVDKIYEAQVFNYGKRLLFDIMLPEPAAFLLYAANGQPKAGDALVRPIPFTLAPGDISEWNYGTYVKRYEVVGVEPPPQPYLTVSKVLDGEADKDQGTTTKSMEVPIQDGYQAVSGNVVTTFTMWEDNAIVDVVVGTNGHRFDKNGGWGWGFSMSNEVGGVPVVLKTWHADVFAVAIEVHTQRTQRKLEEWKLKTHAAILQAYLKLVRDYEDRLAAAEVMAANQVQGRNPLENERLVRTEIKKGAVSVFTNQHFDLFGAISTSGQGYPQPNLPEAAVEGAYIRFFEQAFEWEQMMFFFYPYFWGRKPNWVNRALLQDVDPLFAEFVKAGAARAVVSVRPGFESAVAHFLNTGEVWNGGELPPITSPLYVSIIEEIRERDKAPGLEVAQGDPWNVRLPTTLVKLRNEATLPAWQKNAQGEWVSV